VKNIVSLFTTLVLIVCLALYGALAVAGTSEAGFLMEVCADGVTKTIRIDETGDASDPSHECNDCLMCAQGNKAMPQWGGGFDTAFTMLEVENELAFLRLSVIRQRKISPIPRGPPLIAPSKLSVSGKFMTPLDMHSDGRPLFKDADA
jgi:hypothetical protein